MGKQRGYIVTLGFSGQQASGMQALVSQLCWVGSFGLPMYVFVEPFIRNTTVGCILNRGEPRFSEYFDLHKFSKASTREGYAELASWNDFMKNAPRRTILIRMDGINSTGIRSPTRVVYTARKLKNGCYNLPCPIKFHYLLEQMANARLLYNRSSMVRNIDSVTHSYCMVQPAGLVNSVITDPLAFVTY